ncbi:hypothetical protein ACIA8R_52840 [Nonomuraea sp. NPDC051191]|uniref:hypothetical protein n=1 Tax=Nonomuraea sp. NPDC051191 TaxID=3364372 RepID=UPI00379184F2
MTAVVDQPDRRLDVHHCGCSPAVIDIFEVYCGIVAFIGPVVLARTGRLLPVAGPDVVHLADGEKDSQSGGEEPYQHIPRGREVISCIVGPIDPAVTLSNSQSRTKDFK